RARRTAVAARAAAGDGRRAAHGAGRDRRGLSRRARAGGAMTAEWIAAGGVAGAGAPGAGRSARRGRLGRGTRERPPVVAAPLSDLPLFPPQLPLRAGALTVLTPGATAAQLRSLPRTQRIVALPGTPATPRAERVPDLATALRRFDPVRNVTIVGEGLPVR